MRHRIVGKKLGRNHHQRQALFLSLAKGVFLHGFVKTTQTKAKAVSPLIRRLVRSIYKNDLIAVRNFQKYFQDRNQSLAVVTSLKKAFPTVPSPLLKTTRIKRRFGDQSVIVKLQFSQAYKLEFPPKKEKITK